MVTWNANALPAERGVGEHVYSYLSGPLSLFLFFFFSLNVHGSPKVYHSYGTKKNQLWTRVRQSTFDNWQLI